jgi:hypothetical protein
MTLKLTGVLRREIEIDGEPFTVVLSADGVRLTRKRFRGGVAVSWRALWEEQASEPERSAPDSRDRSRRNPSP